MNFEKPDYKITDYVESNNYGKFELEPLERGLPVRGQRTSRNARTRKGKPKTIANKKK